MADPAFPNVPLAPGVPPVQRLGPPPSDVEKLTGDAPNLKDGGLTSWGIYTQDGKLALDPTSIFAVEFQREFRISDYPIEEGGFESYNKVATPFDIRITVTKDGKLSERKAFLDDMDALVVTLDLFDVVTPERTYLGVNIVRADYKRDNESGGVSLLQVELQAVEVRTTASVQFVNPTIPGAVGVAPLFGATGAPSGADPVNNGSVQPVTPLPEAPAFFANPADPRNIPSGSPLVPNP